MNVAVIYGLTLIVLFALAYVTKRRFGVLGLALAAGAMLSDLWAQKLTPIVASAGFQTDIPPLTTVVAVALVLLPALLLLTSGPTYQNKLERFVGAGLFAALAVALLIEPLGSALILEGESLRMYNIFIDNQVWIVTIGLTVAIVDLLFARTPKHRRR